MLLVCLLYFSGFWIERRDFEVLLRNLYNGESLEEEIGLDWNLWVWIKRVFVYEESTRGRKG